MLSLWGKRETDNINQMITNILLQWKPLNVTTWGHRETDNIK
jgi:hypothetical protein